MSNDPEFDWLIEDLLAVRRLPGTFRDRVKLTRGIQTTLGAGSLRIAWGALEQARRKALRFPESDIAAYFWTSGVGLPGENLDQRLKAYAKKFNVVERTALRRSDRGVAKLARELRDSLTLYRPWVYLILVQRQDQLQVRLHCQVTETFEFNEPAFSVSGVRVEAQEASVEAVEDEVLTVYKYRLTGISLNTRAKWEEPLGSVSIAWRSEVVPIWELVGHMADNRLYAHFTINAHSEQAAEIRWWDEAAAATKDKPPLM